MANAPCIPVPSPQEIHDKLFPEGVIAPPSLPAAWTAQVLLTPFGGQKESRITPSDQLVIGNLTYDARDPHERFMRIRLYLFESLYYYDFLFRTANGQTQWWWLISDPGDRNGPPANSFGPFATRVSVPPRDFLAGNSFSHAGSWSVLGRSCEAFSARRSIKPATWFWFESENLTRIMNVDTPNDFQIPILGAYYFVDLPTIEHPTSSPLRDVYKQCATATSGGPPPCAMVTQSDILLAMSTPPFGRQVKCTLEQIQALLPAIASPPRRIKRPAWTHRVNSECVMIGQETQAYYSQVWYDWDRGTQVTVLVRHENGSYNQRLDDILPKRAPGPSIPYAWNGAQWTPQCCDPEHPGVGMPYPNFVERGKGVCRAIFDDPRLGILSIWSVALEDENGNWMSDFWYWFNEHQQGVIFSLAPAPSLTVIYYQTFVQNGPIPACVLCNPCADLPPCAGEQLEMVRSKPRFFPFTHSLS
jgi:hypothetical protein